MNVCGLTEGTSFELRLTGGSKLEDSGVRVDVDEHEVGDDFGDCNREELESSILTATGESHRDFDDKLTSGDEVDLGENKRVKRVLSEGALEVGVVAVTA